MVSDVSKTEACAAEAPECALEILESSSDAAEIEAALSVIAVVGGGSRPTDALSSVQQQISRPIGLAALAALIPTCDPKQLEFCQVTFVKVNKTLHKGRFSTDRIPIYFEWGVFSVLLAFTKAMPPINRRASSKP